MFKQNANPLTPPPPLITNSSLKLSLPLFKGDIVIDEEEFKKNASTIIFTQTGEYAKDAADVLGSNVTKNISIAKAWDDGGVSPAKASIERTKTTIDKATILESNNVTIISNDGESSFSFIYSKNKVLQQGVIAVSSITNTTANLDGTIGQKVYVKSTPKYLIISANSCCCTGNCPGPDYCGCLTCFNCTLGG